MLRAEVMDGLVMIYLDGLYAGRIVPHDLSPADLQMLADRLTDVPAANPQQISKEAAAIVAVMKRMNLTGLQIFIVDDQPIVRVRREEETAWEAA